MCSVLCDDLEGQDGGEVGGRPRRERMHGIHIADSLHCTAETNTIS